MKTRGIVGKRIVRIHQERGATGRGDSVTNVTAIELEGGAMLIPRTFETERGDYWHTFDVRKVRP